jgi:type 2 lantibiotic biosynthesis protein LanM
VYLLTHLSTLWQEPVLLLEAEQIARKLASLVAQDDALDIMQGAAGAIVSLLGLYRKMPSQELLATIQQCGEHLLLKAQPMSQGIGWVTPLAKRPLTGFSHGAAGIAYALLQVAALHSNPRFYAAARAALAYERSHFLVESHNWRDLRDDATGEMIAWCHGASGIGLGRLAALPYLDTQESRQEIETALEVTLAHGFGLNHSLCHGDFGNLDLLLQAGRFFQRPELQQQGREKASMILESIDRHGWLSGVPLSVETPGLMAGVSGIGYGLLRCVAPDRVPSVLILEPPIENWERKE